MNLSNANHQDTLSQINVNSSDSCTTDNQDIIALKLSHNHN